MALFPNLSSELKQYLVVTGNYWAFTLSDGALRMLVVLYFHQLGFSPLKIAMLFLFYEVFGVITNLVGGWLGARLGLNTTMNIGLAIQIVALSMLLVPTPFMTVAWVMIAQALSGIAKDLNKMSAKSAIKNLVPANAESVLFKWVAILTGSKNALKGVGFFLGGFLLTALGFHDAVLAMLVGLCVVFLCSLMLLKSTVDAAAAKPRFSEIFSKSQSINTLSAARLFLFGARDVWFVVALPVYLTQTLGWQHWSVGTFFASWVIGYGLIQSLAPIITGATSGDTPTGSSATRWALVLAIITGLITAAVYSDYHTSSILVGGLMLFGAVFAINSSLHSYLIVSYSQAENVSMDVGFYYMANAMGRLIGTVLSGVVFQLFGLAACLLISSVFLCIAALVSLRLDGSEA
ncbi:organoarsenical effux MFS transporter ArsJ [Arenicella xantha]|uniref:MFS transporter n=1 Tax=Arenicella xantha TaxID=644221 RepID=A0A395JMV3_9GAMM|nr:organoarsenical effux MFS transporter ArsJ [Arenicella xantha]RBP51147.1 MFS transporter [Arenicella xantha]